jgi:hypothetical protein
MGQLCLLVGKYKKIEVVVNTNHFVAHKAPMKMENVLLHPCVKGHTCEQSVQHVKAQERVKLVGHTWRREPTYVRYGEHECSVKEQVQ